MLYTSGTTGRPKGVHRQPVLQPPSTLAFAADYQAGQDRHLCTGPLYHAAPLSFSLMLPQSHGAAVVLMQRWDAEYALQTDPTTSHHSLPHGAHHVSAAVGTARSGALQVRSGLAPLSVAWGCAMSGQREARHHRVAGTRRRRPTTAPTTRWATWVAERSWHVSKYRAVSTLLTALPRSDNGKLYKQKLRDQYRGARAFRFA
jgi:acyl-coenzyme A synthetase/AMP-(fatty) acid ligase